jgi:hypothetical protein
MPSVAMLAGNSSRSSGLKNHDARAAASVIPANLPFVANTKPTVKVSTRTSAPPRNENKT